MMKIHMNHESMLFFPQRRKQRGKPMGFHKP